MKRAILFFFILASFLSHGQDIQGGHQGPSHKAPIPVEIMAGNNWLMFQNIIARDFGAKERFNYFNLINYEVEYVSEAPASYIVQSLFSYKLSQNFALGAGANLKAFGGFKPLVGGQFTYFDRKFGVVLQPSVELGHGGVAELFGLFEWNSTFEKQWQLYFSIQGASSFATSEAVHDFSYLNTRLGIQAGQYKIGPALNTRFIGSDVHAEYNFGGFISISIQ